LIWEVGINPFGLDWRRFLLAVDERGEMIGCGQVKPHRDGTHELASIAVRSDHRGQGVASAVVRRLLAENAPPLYLICRPSLQPFYTRFDFTAVTPIDTPSAFRWMRHMFALAVMVKRE
jgi:predicted N-acetyltransferase YhbS